MFNSTEDFQTPATTSEEKPVAEGLPVTEKRTVDSVAQFVQLFSPEKHQQAMDQITTALAELGCEEGESTERLAEHLFVDIFLGRPVIDPDVL